MHTAAHPRDTGRQQVIMAAIHALRQVHAEMHRVLGAVPNQEISMADMLVLHHIAHGHGATPGQIVAATGLTSGGVTSLIDRLEEKGLVARTRSTKDRRVVVVSLAPEAHVRMASMMASAHAEAARLFEGWSVTSIAALVDLLAQLRLGNDPR